MSNPALERSFSAAELRKMYEQPAATDADRTVAQRAQPQSQQVGGAALPPLAGSGPAMDYPNVINKTVVSFLVVLVFAAIGWITTPAMPILWIGGAIVGLVLGLVNAFKKEPSPGLILAYAAAQGLFLGGISCFYEAMYSGIVAQAVIGTFSVFAVTLVLFRNGKVRTSPRATKIFMIGMVGYLVFSLVNVVLMLTGVVTDPWGLRNGWLGLAIGAFAVLLAAYSLVMDFETIKRGVEARIPEKYGWAAAFGLTVTLIWLYLEILRIIAIFRGD